MQRMRISEVNMSGVDNVNIPHESDVKMSDVKNSDIINIRSKGIYWI